MLRSTLRLLESDSPAAVLERLGSRPILGLTLGLDVAGDLHPLVARERLQEGWVELLEEQSAREDPQVMLIEDLHWGEEPLLELLERIVIDVQAPLLLLVTAWPDLPEGWRARLAESGTVLELDVLAPQDCRAASPGTARSRPSDDGPRVLARSGRRKSVLPRRVARRPDRRRRASARRRAVDGNALCRMISSFQTRCMPCSPRGSTC